MCHSRISSNVKPLEQTRLVAQGKQREGWFDVTTLKEPYRVEGKKTMGYEVAEQLGWTVPDAILYPCGGGVGLIGMWKAFSELEELGWIGSKRPKMVAVQATGCQPITQAFEQNAPESDVWPDAHTVASGLRVPKPLGDFLVLQAVRESGGTVLNTGFLRPEEQILIYNTGSGLKYLEAYSTRFSRQSANEQDKLGGLITPR
jgi:threonine synthase